jgi:hypothetical protein
MTGDQLLINLVGWYARSHDVLHGVDDLCPTAVVKGHGERQSPVRSGERFAFLNATQHTTRHPPIASAGKANSYTLLVEFITPSQEQGLIEVHQEANFIGGASPIFGGKGVERQPLDTEIQGSFNGINQGFFTCGVTLGALQPTLIRPATIAIHDAGDMARDALGV